MSKKYLIDEEEFFDFKGEMLCQKSDSKEVEVLEVKELRRIETRLNSTVLSLEGFLLLNDLQIIKTVK